MPTLASTTSSPTAMMLGMPASAADLCEFINASPSPFHVCATVAGRLLDAGYAELSEVERWPDHPGRYFIVRAGSLVAWSAGQGVKAHAPFRIVGAHTDSPNLRVKQHPDLLVAGWRVVALQPYGGAWLNSWLDRDLGVSGRLSVRSAGKGSEITDRLVRIDDPILRVPQLAIHLAEDRKSLTLDPQRHVNAVWGVGDKAGSLLEYVAERTGVAVADVLAVDLMTHDLVPSMVIGADANLLSAPRLDNQVSCYAGMEALLASVPHDCLPVLALFDHEEVGSTSDRGARSNLLSTVLERIVLAAGGGRDDYLRRLPASLLVSADMAHATHPNYPECHEPSHLIEVNAGPVLKVHPNLRYATDGRTAAAFEVACQQAGVRLQRYEHRADRPCGSTIGPLASARTGIPTVDVGAAQLAMHSARELMGAHDVAVYSAALQAFFSADLF
ncbi:aminopeptidase 2 [Mycobacterium leprae Kyoto-2]|nr:pepX [Mycobacterium leprae]OAR20014.1 M18 family aminopeptidase [Mycobacterium leprae 3125609]OAX71467.1 M18 family aminopeptidase [Mycobacterium leprae 7935681]CAR72310.1 aminopeptidase I [Mycobacterium leprae Br4923]BBC17616.1 aminopeptidase 2 [Mycobacterium leprae Kyoto-2]